jgi:hypothetical protein
MIHPFQSLRELLWLMKTRNKMRFACMFCLSASFLKCQTPHLVKSYRLLSIARWRISSKLRHQYKTPSLKTKTNSSIRHLNLFKSGLVIRLKTSIRFPFNGSSQWIRFRPIRFKMNRHLKDYFIHFTMWH